MRGPPLRCVYADAARILRDPLGARALEACLRADIEVVVLGPRELAEELGLDAWIGPDQDEREAIAAHMDSRGLSPEDCLLVRDGDVLRRGDRRDHAPPRLIRPGGRTRPWRARRRASMSNSAPPAKATVTSSLTCREESRVPRPA